MSSILNTLRSVQTDALDIEELVSLAVAGKQIRDGFTERALPPPDWLEDSLKALDRVVISRRRDYLEMSLKKAKLKKEGLKSAEEKRRDADVEIAKLEELLKA